MSVSPTQSRPRAGRSSRIRRIWPGALVTVTTLGLVLGLVPTAAATAASPERSASIDRAVEQLAASGVNARVDGQTELDEQPFLAEQTLDGDAVLDGGALFDEPVVDESLLDASPLTSSPEASAIAAAEEAQPALASAGAAPAAVDSAIQPAHLRGFDAGNLIDDSVFYDGSAMTAAQIQSFLDRSVGNCQNGRCLNVLQTSISSRPARVSQATGNVVCNAINGGTMRVSELIYRVQTACGISARVILVTLEKEQSLVTSRAPSDWNLRAAMGAYCPDSAPCDPAFAGVGPQVVAGVTQLKMYRAGAFARQPGVHFIQYNPNEACGGSNVNVVNYATAALYNYTPYQPNAASLAAGYGQGDGCSAYGNRNFYNFFTDWFGTVRGGAGSGLVVAGQDVYLLSGTTRYHVWPSVVQEYRNAWGTPRSVSRSAVDQYRDGGPATRYLRNESNGEVSFLEGGTRHWLGGCGMVTIWGSSCGSETVLAAADYNGLRRGPDMSFFARKTDGGHYHYIVGSNIHTIYNPDTARALNRGTLPYAPTLPAAAAARLTDSYFYHHPGQFIEQAGRVYLPTTNGNLYYLPSWAQAAELGLPSKPYRTVGTAHVRGFKTGATLRSFVTCSGQDYFAASGRLHPITQDARAGLPRVLLDSKGCAELRMAGGTPLNHVFVRAQGTSEVFMAFNGQFRHIASPSLLRRLAGTTSPTVLQISQAFLRTLPRGAAVTSEFELLSPGQFAEVGSRTYLPTQDRRLIYLSNWSVAEEIGLPGRASLRTTEGAVGTHRLDGTLSLWLTCGGVTHFASRGVLHPVSRAAAAGFTASRLDDPICRTLNRSTSAQLPLVFVQAQGTDPVYLATGGTFRHVTSPSLLRKLNGGTLPTVLLLSEASLSRLPKGSPMTP